MVNISKLTQADIEAMSVEAKLELVEALWESIAASPKNAPVPQWQKTLSMNVSLTIAHRQTPGITLENGSTNEFNFPQGSGARHPIRN